MCLAHQFGGPMAALAAAGFCFGHYYIRWIFTAVLTDAAYNAGLIACLFCGFAIQRAQSLVPMLRACLLSGFVLALATSVKPAAPMVIFRRVSNHHAVSRAHTHLIATCPPL
jgi:hypothetical protein